MTMKLSGRVSCSTRRGLCGLYTAVPARHAAPGRCSLAVCRTAASDEKSQSQPMFLSDLIAFETDVEAEVGSPGSSRSSSSANSSATVDFSSGNSSSSGSSLSGSLGLVGSEPDPTQRAQEIINRATEVLAAARAALGTPANATSSSSGGPAPTAAAAGDAPSSAPSSKQSPAAAPGQQRPQTPSSSSIGGSSSGVSPIAAAPGTPPASSTASGPSAGTSSSASGTSGNTAATEALTRRWSQLSDGQDLTRHVLQNALDQMQSSGAPIAAPKDASSSSAGSHSSKGGSSAAQFPPSRSVSDGPRPGGAGGVGAKPSRDIRSGASAVSSKGRADAGGVVADAGHTPAPTWAQSLLGSDDFGGAGGYGPGSIFPPEPFTPQLQPQAAAPAAMPAALAFVDEPPALTLPPVALGLVSQSVLDAQKARTAVLPPLQSVMELTTAYKPPERTGAAPAPAAVAVDAVTGEAVAAAAPVGRALADGTGRLADGTWWEKKSGIEYGKNGYWKRWQLLRGGNAEGTLDWEEGWWEASDYTGLKEMGAEKKGRNAEGAAWRESWSERLMYASNDLDCVVERNAHKWAAEGNGDEWEEKWGEHYHASGKVAKYADKWGKQGSNVWHERWGEDYDSGGDACVKWTDKWAERLLPGGAREQWGDKWREAFANGRGEKNGEVWSVGASGDRYQRWWGEQHLGDRRVRRHGHSTTGDVWDDTIEMDTYYNPVPHFGFKLALQHSPQLRNVPLKPKPINELDPFGPGLDQL